MKELFEELKKEGNSEMEVSVKYLENSYISFLGWGLGEVTLDGKNIGVWNFQKNCWERKENK